MNSRRRLSFVIRLSLSKESKTPWHGDVEYVQNGQRVAIHCLEDLVHFVETQAHGDDQQSQVNG
ncbi:MAG: hypothetical protein NVS2B16_13270 [Chloroflexota bacterium]